MQHRQHVLASALGLLLHCQQHWAAAQQGQVGWCESSDYNKQLGATGAAFVRRLQRLHTAYEAQQPLLLPLLLLLICLIFTFSLLTDGGLGRHSTGGRARLQLCLPALSAAAGISTGLCRM